MTQPVLASPTYLTALGKAKIQQMLAGQEEELSLPAGCSAWIAIGLKLEEQQ